MFLKSLTLRGFKSFADKTTLEFEPGVTVVVGPNGSGKSNLVDAVAWVLGAQGPRTLRGGKMDDVIFAGTAGRPSLGRAEVSLSIDNTSGLLPIEFSEVTITRVLFREGESEYQINGVPCRLLDIQELLSDSGIGRQQHVIVGQGQIDSVLNARPEDRRAIIEEAAGILKYRKRREKAERRLETAESNLVRLIDTMREVKRQLRPLERQAEAARKHDGLASELTTIRLHLAGLELAGLEARQERLSHEKQEKSNDERDLMRSLTQLDAKVTEAEQSLTRLSSGDLADTLARAEALRERSRGIAALVLERQRNVQRELEAKADEGVFDTLVSEAAKLRAELSVLEDEAEELEEQKSGSVRGSTLGNVQETVSTTEHQVHELEKAWRNADAAYHYLRGRVETLEEMHEHPSVYDREGAVQDLLTEAKRNMASAEETCVSAEAEVLGARSALTDAQKSLEVAADGDRARHHELEVNLAALTSRRRVLATRLGEIEQRLARNPEAQEVAEQQRRIVAARSNAYQRIAQRLQIHGDQIESLLDQLRDERRAQSEAARTAAAQLDVLRADRHKQERQLAQLREQMGRGDVDETETRLRLETLVERIRTEFECEPDVARATPAPKVPEGTTLAGQARELERELKLLGPVNPLALEEFAALQERNEFLEKQISDVKASRKDLARIIKEINSEIVTVFTTAFGDVEEHFAKLFSLLFPGGSGRLYLTNPDDPLNTGVEVEARPSGKQVRRLSLLSGGERSMAGIAFLFSVFRSRPSPFYILDEVEAALDDINLHRFLNLVEEFRNEAQLLIVSHQKRTMEVADALYGVTMAPGASSKVVSQRLIPTPV